MNASSATIPYVKQEGATSARMCGAASLCMVYRSFGVECSQDEIWSQVGQEDGRGRWLARTHRLAADALQRGYPAIVLRARDPWPLLQQCQENRVRIILNHRVNARSISGHYSVLVGIENDHALLHDPLVGPSRRLSQRELLQLWSPSRPRSDITGNVMVALSQELGTAQVCGKCEKQLPTGVPCPRCQLPISLHPLRAIGCVNPDCSERTWVDIFCPHCDASMAGPLKSGFANAPKLPEVDLMDPAASINQLMEQTLRMQQELTEREGLNIPTDQQEEIDKMLEQMKAAHSEFLVEHEKEQAEFAEARERIAKRQAEADARLREQEAEAERAQAETEAERAQEESEEPEAEPLDPTRGKMLGQELLRRFGHKEAPSGPTPHDAEQIWENW